MSGQDAKFSGQIFRKDFPMIIAQNRHLASIVPARIAYQSSGYKAGTVLALNSVSNQFAPYDDTASSGLNTAVGVLFKPVEVEDFPSATGSQMARMIIGGELYEDKLVGLDAAAKVDLKSRTVTDTSGTKILKF
jgi:hypothetical protein